ncbi:response regulator transcription factor [Acidaminobacter sp. JC074]|uniref:response regulator n=1 Tax=Acidaminobacter sp. JC074 TaxID=2530199 RepID=UPI001F0CDF1B|nr:response regulator transcription factor [Acidaminobacter sp. JC074]MCH4886511.1 response regulator transcription factor [Acidaminobacter sp. JC074]
MIKILIADDQVLLRKSLGQLISIEEEFKVVDLVATGKEAVEACRRHRPDIVLMDIEMPEMNGITALKRIREQFKTIKVIMLTTFDNKENIVEAFLADADGYITKDVDCSELVSIIKCVNFGLTVIHKSVKEIMVNKFSRMQASSKSYLKVLSEEEIEMIKHIVSGKSNKEIAAIFCYTEGTIKNKVSKIYEKLNITDRLQLAVYAVENGIES